MMRGGAKLATHLALALVLAGFSVILLAWNGAAGLDRIPGQFPYLLSGGLAGLGLIVAGSGILAVQTSRELTAQRARRMAVLQGHMDALVEAAGKRSPSGRGGGGVLAGRRRYHDPSCRLAGGAGDRISVAQASRSGLAPCRVCRP